MPSFQDSAFIILLGLLLFGPKGLAKIARQLGKLVGEFRRASAEFRTQMEDELRVAEQEDQQKKIAAMEAAAPVAPLLHQDLPDPEHPHLPPPAPDEPSIASSIPGNSLPEDFLPDNRIHAVAPPAPAVLPIASSGDLNLMPPATGLPMGRSPAPSSSLNGVFDSIPHAPELVPGRAPGHAPERAQNHAPEPQPQEATANG